MSRPVPLVVRRLGLVPYTQACTLQAQLVEQRRLEEIPDTLLLLQHPPVITLGRGGDEGLLRVSREELASRGIDMQLSQRGGKITYHGPGQLVAYPILRLARPDLHAYLRDLEQVVLDLGAEYGLELQRWEGRTGVWAGSQKLASIGIRATRGRSGGWIVHHGLALNVLDQLEGFDTIVPCGLEGVRMSSLEGLLRTVPPWPSLEDRLVAHFARVTGREVWQAPEAHMNSQVCQDP